MKHNSFLFYLQFDLVCDNSYLHSLSISAYFFGCVFATVSLCPLADVYVVIYPISYHFKDLYVVDCILSIITLWLIFLSRKSNRQPLMMWRFGI